MAPLLLQTSLPYPAPRPQASQDIPVVNPGDGGLTVQATLVTLSAPGGGGDKVPQVFSGEAAGSRRLPHAAQQPHMYCESAPHR